MKLLHGAFGATKFPGNLVNTLPVGKAHLNYSPLISRQFTDQTEQLRPKFELFRIHLRIRARCVVEVGDFPGGVL